MIDINDIYKNSNNGLDIILHYYPQAADCVGTNKKFKKRANEDDASACVKKFDGVYKVTDFGDQGTALSPLDIMMDEENLTFKEALYKAASIYGVAPELRRSVNRPDYQERDATPEEKEGTPPIVEFEPYFTKEQLIVLGPRVKEEHVQALNWYVVKSITYIKDRKAKTKLSTDTYPIFARECIIPGEDGKTDRFYKIYEPLNYDKQWRFSYTPSGKKPRRYVNGLEELRKQYVAYNTQEEKAFFSKPENEDKPYKEKKIDKAFICSGERDALCLKSLGYAPLWFNSETYKPSNEEIKEIYRYVETLYNIPDIDSTGIEKGTELALRFLDIHTVWLPEWLKTYKDLRGKPRKDFRDFMEIKSKNEDFKNLLSLAMPAKFWVEIWSERSKSMRYDIDSECLHYFLQLNGFHTLRDENSTEAKLIRIRGNIVEPITKKDIHSFILDFAQNRYLNRDVRNLIRNSTRLNDSSLDRLSEVDLDFTNYTPKSQFFFFPNVYWEVKANEIVEESTTCMGGDRFVWDTNVLPFHVKQLPPMFKIERKETKEREPQFDITINEHSSCFFNYLINTSRLHWRKELEDSLEDLSPEEAQAYKEKHQFDIAGANLNAGEQLEQKQNLISKIFTIGYCLHRFKAASRAWAPYAMDNKIGEDGQCNGRSGKSFLFKSLEIFMRTVKLSGRNPKLMDNPHVFDQVDKHSEFVLVDDCDRYLTMGLFYDCITSDMTVNPKNNKSYNIKFSESPKFGFTTNYVPHDFDASTDARMLYVVFGDYYHQMTAENDYLETRSIRDDFGKDLFTEYNEEEWCADINFFVQCLQFYLSLIDEPIKIQPPMDNIMKRRFKADMGANFEDWAYSYFSEEGENLDKRVIKSDALESFKRHTGLNNWTMQRFTKALKGFVRLCPYVKELNPAELLNGSGRLIAKIDNETKEMIYLRTYNDPLCEGITQENKDDSGLPF